MLRRSKEKKEKVYIDIRTLKELRTNNRNNRPLYRLSQTESAFPHVFQF